MKRMLCVVLAMLLLPAIALAEEIHLLWDIPFPQSAAQFAREVERVKGIKMETTPLKAPYSGSIIKTETAIPVPGQDLQLFGIPFKLEYSHARWNAEERGGVDLSSGERIVITFAAVTRRTLGDGASPEQAYDIGVARAQSIWNELIKKYGSPSSVSITYESNHSEWWNGLAAYVKEVRVVSPQDVQALLENASSFIKNAWDSYPYPGIGRSILINLYFGNVNASALYDIYSDGSYGFDNVLVYNTSICNAPEPSLEQKEQKQPYSDTGL